MAQCEHILHFYQRVRAHDRDFEQLISSCKARRIQHGFEIMFRDADVPDDIITMLVLSNVYDEVCRKMAEMNPSTDSSIGEGRVRIEALPAGEEMLAEEVRNQCDVFGREKLPDLQKSAQYLLLMGLTYSQYATSSILTDIDQKLNFLRATTLVNAAIVRLRLLEKGDGYRHAVEELKSLHKRILEASVSKIKDRDFVDFSNSLRDKANRMRLEEIKSLSQVKRMRNQTANANAREVNELEKRVFTAIRLLSISNSDKYTSLMKDIIKECLNVMGDPPDGVTFAIAGLGSLARQEVTLSSDFEHVIILDDVTPITDEIREYFRWFTIIFQVIVIGIGETVIPSMDIKSLSDQYSSDVKKKWFMDVYTPCGISFDGMMPHACKCPLGRQKPTQKRGHIVELIQPASVMASYLTQREELKNGYMLQDVLGTSCFVYGSYQVYDTFFRKSREIRNILDLKDVSAQLQEFLKKIGDAWKPTTDNVIKYIDVKKTIYRPITVLLHCLASFYDLSSQSSFDVIDELQSLEIIDAETGHILSQGVAAALELRMRCYQTKQGQRNASSGRDLAKLIGESTASDCKTTIMFLIAAFKCLMVKSMRGQDFSKLVYPSRDSILWVSEDIMNSYVFRGVTERSIEECLTSMVTLLTQYRKDEIADGKALRLLWSHTNLFSNSLLYLPGNYTFTNSEEYWDMYFWANNMKTALELDNASVDIRDLLTKSGVLYEKGRHQEADDILNECIIACQRDHVTDSHTLSVIARLEIHVKNEIMKPSEAIDYFNNALAKTQNFYRANLYQIGIAMAYWRKCMTEIAQTALKKVGDDTIKNRHKLTETEFRYLMRRISEIFIRNRDVHNARYFLEIASETMDARFPGGEASEFTKFTKIHMLTHYKYNFGPRWNAGRYSNFTYCSSYYEYDLALNAILSKHYSSLQIFSSVRYHDMMTLIEYVLSFDIAICNSQPKVWHEWKNESDVTALMALCEAVTTRDLELFCKLLKSASKRALNAKMLQPFLYSCFNEFQSHCSEIRDFVAHHRFDSAKIFGVSTAPADQRYASAVNKYTTFDFATSAKLTWKLLHCEKTDKTRRNPAIELLLSNVLAVMIGRKRTAPLAHRRKCRELSLKQVAWWDVFKRVGNQKLIAYNRLFQQSRYYARSANPVTHIYNLAVDCLMFDYRSCAALLWKLIHFPLLPFMDRNLLRVCIVTLFEALSRMCGETLQFSYVNRMS